jgi:hypothetical protein
MSLKREGVGRGLREERSDFMDVMHLLTMIYKSPLQTLKFNLKVYGVRKIII